MFNKIISLLILLGVSPILFIFMLLIVIFDNHNPIFIQERIGKNMKLFNIYKLRTMKNNQVTILGYNLRKFSIDELPQFFNVILGDMNIIGPRPLTAIDYNCNIKGNFNDRTQVLPGITGYHQIYGTTNDSNEKIELDMHYINNMNYRLNLKIFFDTIRQILVGKKLHI